MIRLFAFAFGFLIAVQPLHVLAWDPLGDLANPGRILDNVVRETDRAVRDIPNVPRNIERETREAGRNIDRWRLEGQANLGAPAFEQWLIESRNSAASGGTYRIPDDIRAMMTGFYDEDTLNRVRFKVGDHGVINLANLSIQYGDAGAVTLIDVVVFANDQAAADPVLWAHELRHVQQFRDWGTRDFAIRYLRSWNSVEGDASNAENQFAQRLAQGDVGRRGGGQGRGGGLGNWCATPFGVFGPGPAAPLGSPCPVMTPNGPFTGQIVN